MCSVRKKTFRGAIKKKKERERMLPLERDILTGAGGRLTLLVEEEENNTSRVVLIGEKKM